MGRRWGKTYLSGYVAIDTAQQGQRVAWVVPSYKNARPVWRWVEQLTGTHLRYGVRVNKSERFVEFPNGGFLGVFSADNPDSLRGDAYHLVVMDEGARQGETVFTDVILPTLADYNGDLIIPSTPKGKNWFYHEYQRGLADMKEQASFHAATSANPSPNIQEAFLKARERLTERSFREEWLAEFIDGGGSVFRRIDEAKYSAPLVSTPQVKHRYVAGLDWAQSYDYTVMLILDTDEKRVVEFDRFNKIDWQTQRQRVKVLSDKWHLSMIYAELNSIGSPNVEALQADGLNVIGMTTTNESKATWIQSLSLAFERNEIKIPDEPTLIGELNAYEMERLPSGRWRYGAPDGLHDDCVMALALAWYGMHDVNTQLVTAGELPQWFQDYRG